MMMGNSLQIGPRPMTMTEREQISENIAAKKIQTAWRSYQSTEQGMPDRICFQKAREYTKNILKLASLPTAGIGHATVFFPPHLPAVIKKGRDLQDRMSKETFAREQCQKLGLHSLVVPSSELDGELLIARKLPILTDMKDQIALYVENRDLFTDAVTEFVKFNLDSRLKDIVGGRGDYQELSKRLYKTRLGRYDNVALYLKKGKGIIGLIDLEHLKLPEPEPTGLQFLGRKKERELNDIWALTRDAITLFPYHFEEIFNEVKKVYPDIEKHQAELEEVRNNVVQVFKFLYEDHRDFNLAKQKTEKSPALEISDERQADIKTRVKNEVRNTIMNYPSLRGCFGKDEDAGLSLFMEQTFPDLFQATLKIINTAFNKYAVLNDESAKEKGPNTPLPSFVSSRSFAFQHRDFYRQPSKL